MVSDPRQLLTLANSFFFFLRNLEKPKGYFPTKHPSNSWQISATGFFLTVYIHFAVSAQQQQFLSSFNPTTADYRTQPGTQKDNSVFAACGLPLPWPVLSPRMKPKCPVRIGALRRLSSITFMLLSLEDGEK